MYFQVLWGGFCVIGRRRRFYFPGDTGYVGVMFKQIGQKYGPFDLAALPIGAYEPRCVQRYVLTTPFYETVHIRYTMYLLRASN